MAVHKLSLISVAANVRSAVFVHRHQNQALPPSSGAVTLEGKMIDYANVRIARRIIGLGS
ncbi:hypothetical protein [Bradyrhizobium sp. 195]|uniref:hypothetical protein n=1 Tax=Bradyrhizobium sp. 195 TaxID=2782662 RepID=UPI0020006428|nr:hypothetical protein [Bradyrhizobium sp. 195]UPK30823.1 hypothetical protein IVB26_32630 [Bradyrhizobium sp. 195]